MSGLPRNLLFGNFKDNSQEQITRGKGKKLLGNAKVYVHAKGESGATVTHIDIELDELNKILKPGENSFVGAKEGGVFIGLKKEMIERAEKILEKN